MSRPSQMNRKPPIFRVFIRFLFRFNKTFMPDITAECNRLFAIGHIFSIGIGAYPTRTFYSIPNYICIYTGLYIRSVLQRLLYIRSVLQLCLYIHSSVHTIARDIGTCPANVYTDNCIYSFSRAMIAGRVPLNVWTDNCIYTRDDSGPRTAIVCPDKRIYSIG